MYGLAQYGLSPGDQVRFPDQVLAGARIAGDDAGLNLL
jgi:hypothetical protein